MSGNIITLKGVREAPKAQRSSMETIIVTNKEVAGWKLPPFQRPLRVNKKVQALSEELKANGGIMSGVLTLGRLPGDPSNWIVDGQHRIEGFKISGLEEIITDVRIMHFKTMAEMAQEFVELNSALVRMRPDDILRGMEESMPPLAFIRAQCEFVAYDQIRRGDQHSAVLSMSTVIRSWIGSTKEVPSSTGLGSALEMAQSLDMGSAQNLVVFLLTAHQAWGSDPENYRLWGNLNLSVTMWLWRKLVIEKDRRGNTRYVALTPQQFKQCLMFVSASSDYIDWLLGRSLTERDRSPCYAKLKALFIRRLGNTSDGKKPMLPQPSWAQSHARSAS